MADFRFKNGYRILSDTHQWIVQLDTGRLHKQTKQIEWLSLSYHTTIKGAFMSLLKRLARESQATTLSSLLDEMEKTKAVLSHDLSVVTKLSDLLGE